MEYVRTFTRELHAGDKIELAVENRGGSVTVRGEDTRTVRVEVVAHLWGETEDEADDQAELISRGIRQEGSHVTIRAPALLRPHALIFFGRTPRIDYTITVPRDCAANISSRSGRVEVERTRGPLEISAKSGKISVREVEGGVRIASASSSTQAEAIGGSLDIESRSGSVRAGRIKGNVTINARSGSVQVEDVGGNVTVQTRSGSAGVAGVGGSLRLSAMSGSVRYEGPVRAAFDIELVSGSVRLALDANSVFFLDAESGSGSVRSDLPVRPKSSPPPKDAPTVRIRARSGSIAITSR